MTKNDPFLRLPQEMPVALTDVNAVDLYVPPYLRAPKNGTREASVNMLDAIDSKINKLAKLGVHPHSNLLDYRRELQDQLDSNGPYSLRVSSGIF